MGKHLHCGVSGKEWAKWGLGLAGLDHCSRLWDIGAVPSCLVPGQRVVAKHMRKTKVIFSFSSIGHSDHQDQLQVAMTTVA